MVAQVFVRNALFQKLFVDEYMLNQGLAEVYQGGGAVYGPLGLQGYLDLESQAKTKGLGMWSIKNRESASDYKKRIKQ